MKHRSLIALVAVGALTLAACGDDDDGADTTAAGVAVETEAPAADTEAPAVDTEAPAVTEAAGTEAALTEPSAATTEAAITEPAVATTEAAITEPSAATTEAAVATTEAAVATTEAAVATTEAPVATTEAAVATTEAAVATTEAAVATTETPVATTEAVVATTEAVVATTETPVATTEAAVATTETPVATTEPSADTTEPSADTTEPSADTTEAVAATVAVADTTEPSADTTEPSADTTEPSADTTEAVVGTTEATTDTTEAAGTEPAGTEAASSGPDVSFPVTPGPDWPEELVFTFTPSQEAGGIVEEAEPLAVMLEERLGVDVEPIVAADYAAVSVALQSDQAQLAGGLGPIQMVQAEDDAGADLILQSERDGQSTYVTQWFTNDPDTFCADEPIEDPETGFLYCNGVTPESVPSDGPIGQDQLALVENQTVAFVDQGSASGFLIPSIQLSEVGLDPVADIDAQFAGSHDGAIISVYNGDATVGVSFNDARTVVADQFPDVGEKVVVFAWSSPIPNDGFAVAGDLPQDLKDAITAALIDISNTPEGAEVLDTLYEITALVPADPSSFDFIRDQLAVLDDLIE